MPPAARSEPNTVPLCVNLDGTVIKSDMLWESLVRLLQRNPLYLLRVPFWLARGRAGLKAQLAQRVEVDVAKLPYHEPFLAFLREERLAGREIWLVTASDRRMAEPVAAHLGLFAEVLASDGQTNLRGRNKVAALAGKFGERGFDYAGNSVVDLPVWARSRAAIVVNASPGLEAKAQTWPHRPGVSHARFLLARLGASPPAPSMGEEPHHLRALGDLPQDRATPVGDPRPGRLRRLFSVRLGGVYPQRPIRS